jgi:hypothetical protein
MFSGSPDLLIWCEGSILSLHFTKGVILDLIWILLETNYRLYKSFNYVN